jgi:phenylalanyl-tRNA synthetase beta chain
MKILYSQLKKLVPGLKASPLKVGEALTLTGFMMDGLEKISYQEKEDYLIGLEIRQNRADCLSVLGIAQEVAAYWGLKCRNPLHLLQNENLITSKPLEFKTFSQKQSLAIEIRDKEPIHRILAVEIKNLQNKKSPKWLKDFLSFYEINSVNFLVDLSNYVMLITGYPSHLLDKNKIQGELTWSLNKNFSEITTLDNSKIKLGRKEDLIIQDQKNILALAGIIGGKIAALGLKTNSIIAEMAIYDRTLIRRNSSNLKIVTEASNRLEKDLDTCSATDAFNLLISLILDNCGGEIVSKIFDFYPQRRKVPTLKLDLQDPGSYAGIEISPQEVISSLKNLRFQVKQKKQLVEVTPPSDRMDINIKEDLVEEVIRMVGYDKIPVNQPPRLEIVDKITPLSLKLAEKIKDTLTILGFDEILSSPLIKKEENEKVNYRNWEIITTQNSVNEEYPELRQSMAPGLMHQAKEYSKRGIKEINIFEIGKIFGEKNGKYYEQDALGILIDKPQEEKALPKMEQSVEKCLRALGIDEIQWFKSKKTPLNANPHSCWDLIIGEKNIGILYKLKLNSEKTGNFYFAEIDLSQTARSLKGYHPEPTVELTKKIVTLDVNLELPLDTEIPLDNLVSEKIKEIRQQIGGANLWSLKVRDIFPLKNKVRCTLRISYKELSDPQAKKLHNKVFKLKKY